LVEPYGLVAYTHQFVILPSCDAAPECPGAVACVRLHRQMQPLVDDVVAPARLPIKSGCRWWLGQLMRACVAAF